MPGGATLPPRPRVVVPGSYPCGMTTPRITVAERRARLVPRHGLAAPVPGGPVGVAGALVTLHSTDPATVYLSVAARAPIVPADLERALYQERTLVRMLGMRRTVFVVPT